MPGRIAHWRSALLLCAGAFTPASLAAESLRDGLNQLDDSSGGVLTVSSGHAVVERMQIGDPPRQIRVQVDAIERAVGATAVFSGLPEQLRITAAQPNLSGGGSGAAERGVLPWATAPRAGAGGFLYDLLTHEPGIGLRPLDPAVDYLNTIPAGAGRANVLLRSGQSVAADSTINSLQLQAAPLTLDGASLTVSSGGLVLRGSTAQNAQITGTGSLVLPREGIIHIDQGRHRIDVPVLTDALTVVAGSTSPGQGLVLGRANPHAGGTFLNGGRLVSAAQGALGTGPVRLGRAVSLEFERESQTLTNPISVSGAGGVVYVDVPAGLDVTFGGTVSAYGSGAVLGKGRGGTLRLNGDVLLNGLVATDGVLEVNGTARHPGGSAFFADTGSTGFITGTGTLQGRLEGNASPGRGTGAGRLSVESYWPDPSFDDPARVLRVDLLGNEPGDGYDQLVVLRESRFGPNEPGLEAVLDVNLQYEPAEGQRFLVVDNRFTGTGGQFNGLPEGAFFSDGGHDFRITYAGGDGNDVVLTVMPEPTAAGLFGLLGVTLLGRRTRSGSARH